MPVVSDTSPLTNLAIIDQLELLREQFAEITIPEAVSKEVSRLKHVRGREAIFRAEQEGWLTTTQLDQPMLADLLGGQLDRGEAEAIAMAVEVRADWLLMDERDGRRVAARAGLRVVGVLGILLKARVDGRIGSLQKAVQKLRSEAHFFIREDLERQLLGSVGE